MKAIAKAFVLALVILCSGPIASASTFNGAIHGGSVSAQSSANIYRIFAPSYAQRSGSFVLLSGSKASSFGRHLTLGERAARDGELVLGLMGYKSAGSPARRNGLGSFVDSSSAAVFRSAAAGIRSFAALLPDSSEPNILLLLGIGLMGSSLLVLRRRRAVSA